MRTAGFGDIFQILETDPRTLIAEHESALPESAKERSRTGRQLKKQFLRGKNWKLNQVLMVKN